MCSLLREEIYKNLIIREKKNLFDFTCIKRQTNLNEKMRFILLDWIIEIIQKFKTPDMEVLFLCGGIIDKCLESKEVIKKNKFQLFGIAALRIAYKYEENYVLELDECVYYCDGAFSLQECKEMENKIVLEILNYNLTFPTSYTFLDIYLDVDASNDSVKKLGKYLLVKILPEYNMLKFKPSIIASSVIYFSKKETACAPYWSTNLRKLTDYKVRDLNPCIAEIKKITTINFENLKNEWK